MRLSRMVSRKCSSGEATRRAMGMGGLDVHLRDTETQRKPKEKTFEGTE